jgi:hypothetical protein
MTLTRIPSPMRPSPDPWPKNTGLPAPGLDTFRGMKHKLLRWVALPFLGTLLLLGCLYVYSRKNTAEIPFFYSTR